MGGKVEKKTLFVIGGIIGGIVILAVILALLFGGGSKSKIAPISTVGLKKDGQGAQTGDKKPDILALSAPSATPNPDQQPQAGQGSPGIGSGTLSPQTPTTVQPAVQAVQPQGTDKKIGVVEQKMRENIQKEKELNKGQKKYISEINMPDIKDTIKKDAPVKDAKGATGKQGEKLTDLETKAKAPGNIPPIQPPAPPGQYRPATNPYGAPAVAGQQQMTPKQAVLKSLWSRDASGNSSAGGGGLMVSASARKETEAKGPKLPDFLKPYMYYRASVFSPLSSDLKGNNVLIMDGTSGNLKGWKIMATAQADLQALRYQANITQIQSPSGKQYRVSGFVYSIDETPGIVSAVRHDEIPGLALSAGLAAGAAMADAMREDTTNAIVSDGAIVQQDVRARNRWKEAGKAGISEGFKEAKSQAAQYIKRVPTVMVEKGTPVFVMFYDTTKTSDEINKDRQNQTEQAGQGQPAGQTQQPRTGKKDAIPYTGFRPRLNYDTNYDTSGGASLTGTPSSSATNPSAFINK